MNSINQREDSSDLKQQKSVLSKEDRQMFMQLGLVATSNFLSWEGHALFGQLLLADPEAAYPRVGLAYCKIMGGQFADAHKLLNHPIVESSSLRDYATALRGFAYHLAKQPEECEKLFTKNEKNLRDDLAAITLFKNLLDSAK
ncbi:MAG: hypothetical protein ACH346_01780 [Chthoniobacterales bacterium]